MTRAIGNLVAPLEPDPATWLTPERASLLLHQFAPCASILRQSGLWRAVLGYWVRLQISLEVEWFNEAKKPNIDELVIKWQEKNPEKAILLTDEEMRCKIRVPLAASLWSRQQWSHKLETLYLNSKNDLDQASCRLLRLDDKNIAFELYHRIKAGESTFERASSEFGVGPERFNGGLINLQPLKHMPFGLAPLLERLKPGQLSMPLRLTPDFCLVQLISYEPCQLDSRTEDYLLAEQLRLWIDTVVDVIVSDLCFDS